MNYAALDMPCVRSLMSSLDKAGGRKDGQDERKLVLHLMTFIADFFLKPKNSYTQSHLLIPFSSTFLFPRLQRAGVSPISTCRTARSSSAPWASTPSPSHSIPSCCLRI